MERKTQVTSSLEPIWARKLHAKGTALGLPIAGTFELTARCNFGCKMCYVHDRNSEGELSTNEWIELGREARDKGMIFLLLTGGEPLIRPDFKEIYTALSQMGLLLSINTNASLIDDDMFAFFCKHPPLRMNISLYACDDPAYTAFCGQAACGVVKKNIRRLREAGITVKINSSITPLNCSEIEGIFSFAQEVGVPVQATTYMFPPARINGKQYGDAPARFTAEDAAAYMLRCKEAQLPPECLREIAEGIRPSEDILCGDEGENMRCRAGKSTFWVTWDGRMLPCGMFPIDGFPVRKIGFDQAWESVRALTSTVMMPKECTACPQKDHCAVCAAACLTETGASSTRPDYVCRLTREYDRLLCEKYKGMEQCH